MKSLRFVALTAAVMIIAGGTAFHASADTVDSAAVNPDSYTRVFGPGRLPQAIAEAFYASYPKGRINHIEKEANGNLTAYEIQSVDGDIHRDILYRPDGTALEIEEIIPSSQLPKSIAHTLSKQLPDGVVYRAERISRDNSTSFEIIVRDGDRNIELVLTQSGKVLSRREVADYSDVTDQPAVR